ncbi:MAG: hypothetical protein ACK4RT_06865 [Erythrobacter sp.]
MRRKSKRAEPDGNGESRLPSPDPVTNLVIADIVLRGAGSLLRQRLERGLLTGQLESDKAKRLVEARGVVSALALWGASRLATRSPAGLAVVAGALAAKVLYDRGKRIEAQRRTKKAGRNAAAEES